MEYGILMDNDYQPAERIDSVGFYQWLNVFHGRMIDRNEALTLLKDGDYDIVHLRLSRENLALIHRIRERLGPNSTTKLVLSLELPVRYWNREFNDPELLKTAVSKGDFVFAAESHIAQVLEEFSGKTVYEIPHPADVTRIRTLPRAEPGHIITILYSGRKNIKKYILWLRLLFQKRLGIRVLAYRYQNRDDMNYYRQKNIDFVCCDTEAELITGLTESRLLILPEIYPYYGNEYHQYENLVVYAAIAGTPTMSANHLGAMRRCYPELTKPPFKNYLLLYRWLKRNPAIQKYLSDTARSKAEYYDWGNLQKRFLDRLFDETQDERFRFGKIKFEHPSLFRQIHPVCGPQTIGYHNEEFAVVCLVKDGAEYINAFMDHYQRLGTKHFFFIDNGSTDATVALLKSYPHTTIYETSLLHKKYECEIRRAIIEEHCRNKWCLCVDIDELFDYPYSNRIPMQLFLRYLNSHNYTAVLSYLLDMFAKEPEFSLEESSGDLVSKYCYYDISHLKKSRYHWPFTAFTNYNRLSDPKMRNYSGGIRGKVFKNKNSGYLLTKHPLLFIDSKIEPLVHPHFSNNASIADVNGVLKHYKFIDSFKDKVIRSLESGAYSYYAEQEYKEYYNVLKRDNYLSLYSHTSQKLYGLEQLIRKGFIRISKTYRAYVESIT